MSSWSGYAGTPMILLDSNILIDIWEPDPLWSTWSGHQLRSQALLHDLAISPIVYAEVSLLHSTPRLLDERLEALDVEVLNIPRQAAFLAGKAYQQYRRKGGTKGNVLPDFFIGAHAAVLACPILTRDTRRYTTYFPMVRLIAP